MARRVARAEGGRVRVHHAAQGEAPRGLDPQERLVAVLEATSVSDANLGAWLRWEVSRDR